MMPVQNTNNCGDAANPAHHPNAANSTSVTPPVIRPDSSRWPGRDKSRLAAIKSAVNRLAISRPCVTGRATSSLTATTMACIRNEKAEAACTMTMAC